MRRATRITLAAIALTLLCLLALGAVPQYLGGGDTHYMTATEIDEDRPALDVNDVDDRRYPYLTGALETGRSEPYEEGVLGVKEWFTHTPFGEMNALEGQADEDSVDDGGIYVERNGTLYRIEITQAP